MRRLPALPTLATAALGVALLAPPGLAHTHAPGEELPGYYQWYKRSGDLTRLDQEVERDRAMVAGDTWAPVKVGRQAPDWSFPAPDGTQVPLRVGGEGRQTLVVTFQSWW